MHQATVEAAQGGFAEWFLRRGRITRRTYWLHYTLPVVGLTVLAAVADSALGYPGWMTTNAEIAGAFWGITGGPLGAAVALFTLVPCISASVTRLHDRDESAWWLLLCLIPVGGAVVLLIKSGCLAGSGLPNRYGPPPLPGQPGSRPWRF